jgi:hypothetical protein
LAATAFDDLSVGVPAFDEALELGIKVGLGARPKVMKAAACLRDELIGCPGLQTEQAQDRKRSSCRP